MQMITSTSDAPGDISQRAARNSSQQTATAPPWGVLFRGRWSWCVLTRFFRWQTLVTQWFEWLGIRGRNLKSGLQVNSRWALAAWLISWQNAAKSMITSRYHKWLIASHSDFFKLPGYQLFLQKLVSPGNDHVSHQGFLHLKKCPAGFQEIWTRSLESTQNLNGTESQRSQVSCYIEPKDTFGFFSGSVTHGSDRWRSLWVVETPLRPAAEWSNKWEGGGG